MILLSLCCDSKQNLEEKHILFLVDQRIVYYTIKVNENYEKRVEFITKLNVSVLLKANYKIFSNVFLYAISIEIRD